jgi:hypothetical protein
MSAAGYGALAGAGIGIATNMLSMRSANKQAINSIKQQGEALKMQGSNLISNLKLIQYNRDELDRDLGDILSADALATAKNMATAKVYMSTRGTVGGTSGLVSKQVFIDQIQADAEAINKYRKEDVNMLTSQLAKQIDFATAQRQSQWNMDATRAGIASPFAAMLGTMSAAIGGASAGASMGQGIEKMGSVNTTATPTAFQPSSSAYVNRGTLPTLNFG